jgi:hypothetical protein
MPSLDMVDPRDGANLMPYLSERCRELFPYEPSSKSICSASSSPLKAARAMLAACAAVWLVAIGVTGPGGWQTGRIDLLEATRSVDLHMPMSR